MVDIWVIYHRKKNLFKIGNNFRLSLGFYEGGYIYPNPVTWLDRATIAIIGGVVLANKNRLMHKVEID